MQDEVSHLVLHHVQDEVIGQPRPTTVPVLRGDRGSGLLVTVCDCRELVERPGEPLELLRELSAVILPASLKN